MSANAETSQELVTDLKRVVRDSEDLLRDSAGAVGEGVHELRERLTAALELAKKTCRRLEEKAKEGAKVTDKAIREHPYQALAIGLGVGVMIGYLIRRR